MKWEPSENERGLDCTIVKMALSAQQVELSPDDLATMRRLTKTLQRYLRVTAKRSARKSSPTVAAGHIPNWTFGFPLLQNARNLESLKMGSESRADTTERQSILVVDDERPVVESLLGALKDAGYCAFGADSGNEAIKLFESNRVDLVLLEFALPDNSGDVVGRRMKLLKPKVPIIIFTVLPDDANECCDFAEVVIAKPQHPESVIERVKEVLGQRV